MGYVDFDRRCLTDADWGCCPLGNLLVTFSRKGNVYRTNRARRETRAEADDSVGRQIEGLGCRVFPSGHKAYVLSYRTGQRKHLATIGRCSELSLRQTRVGARGTRADQQGRS